jgi:hypothetical protein
MAEMEQPRLCADRGPTRGRFFDAHSHRHSGARAKLASPESMTAMENGWIPGSPLRGAPE